MNPPRAAGRRAWAAWLLALALLLAQALGQWHRVAHALPATPAQAHTHTPAQAQAQAHTPHAFDDHAAGGAECRLLDQLGQAEAPAWAPPPLAGPGAPPRPPLPAVREARPVPTWCRHARGPPPA